MATSSDDVERKARQPLKKNEKQDDEVIIIMEEDPLHVLLTADKRKKNSQRQLEQPTDEQLEEYLRKRKTNSQQQLEQPTDEQLEEYLRKEKKVLRDFELALIGRIVAPLEAIDPRIASLGLKPPQLEEEETTPPGTIYIDHSLIATSAVQELCALANDNNGILWTKSPIDGRDIIDEQHYEQTFPRPNSGSFSWTEGSRASAVVNMEPIRLAQELTCTSIWSKLLFPSIVLEAIKIRVLFNGSSLDNPDGSLQLIYTELQATTPIVPKRSFVFLRTCKQIDESTWVVADVSIEPSGNVGYPSGCWIQGTPEGLSKVVWVEHLKVEQKSVERKFYNRLSHIGFAFGAERWVACLERSCERNSYEMETDILVPGLSESPGGDTCDYEKRYMMDLSQRMVCAFCSNISPTIDDHPWSFASGPKSLTIYATVRRSPYYDDPKEMVVVAATTFRLSQSPEFVFEILGDERRRHEWDMSGRPKGLTKWACYTTGNDPRNNISVYEIDESAGRDLILQESSVNRSGSLVVWSMVKYKEFDAQEPMCLPMCLPLNTLSGFAISHQNTTSSSSNTGGDGGGSFVTLALQLRAVGSKPLHELEPKKAMPDFINKYMKETVRRVAQLLKKESAVQLKTSQEEDG